MNPYRALIANDGYAATFQSMGQYRTALLEAWPTFIDLEDLADELLAPREIRRDASGHLQHPAMPSLGESVCIVEFLSAFGLECDAVAMEDDDHGAWERYTEAENTDCSFWTPSTPAGDGWLLLEIFESEDGPSALYARRKPDAQRYSRRANPSPFAATVTRVRRRTGELLVQLGHQAPDRMYPGTTVSLHWPAASAQPDSDDDPTTKEQYRRMFGAACSDLGLVNEKLQLDPNDGGAAPILAAIDELLATSTAAGQGDLVATVRAMLTMLESGEWAEHVANTTGNGNPLAQRLEDAITDLHNEASANRDMLDDARTELDMLRRALSVEEEPHQSLRERLLEAAQKSCAEANQGAAQGTLPDGHALVPKEPTPEIIAAAAAAAWPVASVQDIEMAKTAARLVLMTMDAAPGATLESIAAAIATMAPAYRAMIGAALRASKESA